MYEWSKMVRSRSRRSSRRNDCRRPRGFSMIAHCKAIGKIPRTSKKHKGKYMKSPKYKRRRSRSR